MDAPRWARWTLFWLALGLVWLALPPVARAQGRPMELRSAQLALQVEGQTVRSPVSLPYAWDRLQPGRQGWAHFTFELELADEPQQPWGLYLPRVGNAAEVWLNGRLMQRWGDLQHFDGADYAKVPRYVALAAQLRTGRNVLSVRIRADVGRKAGLAVPVMGPAAEVYPLYHRAYRQRGTGTVVVLVVTVIAALAAWALWWTQMHRDANGRRILDSLYLAAAVGHSAWVLRVGDTVVDAPPLPWPLWGAGIVVAWGLWASGMAMMCAYAAGWQPRRPRWFSAWLGCYLACGALCSAIALVGRYPGALTAWYGVGFALFLVFTLWYAVQTLRQSAPHQWVMLLALGANVATGLYDLWALRLSDAYGADSIQRFTALLFVLALGYVVFTRFRTASAQARELTLSLEARVAQREAELAHTYARMEQLARGQERSSERSRILSDMHDGVGVHLSMALRQVQSGDFDPQHLAGTLQEGLDQLKLSIDGLNLPPGDITALLASLRYRLEPRLRSAALELVWQVDDMAPLPGMDDKAMRHLQFALYEAVANVIQHAHARTLTVQARTLDGGVVRLRLVDDGCGFDVNAPAPRGLAMMRERARACAAQLRLHSEPGHTQIELEWAPPAAAG